MVLVLRPPLYGTHSRLAFATLPLPIPFVAFLKLTASSRPSAPPSDSPKCLRFDHWLTLCTVNIHLLTYLLLTATSNQSGQNFGVDMILLICSQSCSRLNMKKTPQNTINHVIIFQCPAMEFGLMHTQVWPLWFTDFYGIHYGMNSEQMVCKFGLAAENYITLKIIAILVIRKNS